MHVETYVTIEGRGFKRAKGVTFVSPIARIKAFFGTSENAVKMQIWIAISVYVLVAILKKRLGVERDLYTILQILSLSLFEKVAMQQVLTRDVYNSENSDIRNQLSLFDF